MSWPWNLPAPRGFLWRVPSRNPTWRGMIKRYNKTSKFSWGVAVFLLRRYHIAISMGNTAVLQTSNASRIQHEWQELTSSFGRSWLEADRNVSGSFFEKMNNFKVSSSIRIPTPSLNNLKEISTSKHFEKVDRIHGFSGTIRHLIFRIKNETITRFLLPFSSKSTSCIVSKILFKLIK